MLKQWISSQICPDISLKWSDIQHNWLEIVCCPAVILSSVYGCKVLNCYMHEHFHSLLLHHFCILSIMSILWAWCFGMHEVSIFWAWCFSIVRILFTQNVCILHHSTMYLRFFNTAKVLYICNTILLTLECHILALWATVKSSNQVIQKRKIKQPRTTLLIKAIKENFFSCLQNNQGQFLFMPSKQSRTIFAD